MDAPPGCLVFDRNGLTKILVTGLESALFLHNLCTQDIKGLPPFACREAFLCTAKARLVGHLWVNHLTWQDGSCYLLDADPGQGDRLIQHLSHYLVSEQAEITDVTRQYGCLRLAGPATVSILQHLWGQTFIDLLVNQIRDLGEGTWVRRLDLLGTPTFDLFCPVLKSPPLMEAFIRAGAVNENDVTYESLRIEVGLPRVGLDMDENRFVVETGRGPQAISYTKGCYLGQEPIVMARDRGQVNRQLMGVRFQGSLPSGETKLFRDETEVGQVTSTTMSPRFGPIGLAYLRRGCQQPGSILTYSDAKGTHQAVLASLPFGSSWGEGTPFEANNSTQATALNKP